MRSHSNRADDGMSSCLFCRNSYKTVLMSCRQLHTRPRYLTDARAPVNASGGPSVGVRTHTIRRVHRFPWNLRIVSPIDRGTIRISITARTFESLRGRRLPAQHALRQVKRLLSGIPSFRFLGNLLEMFQ